MHKQCVPGLSSGGGRGLGTRLELTVQKIALTYYRDIRLSYYRRFVGAVGSQLIKSQLHFSSILHKLYKKAGLDVKEECWFTVD